MVSLVASSFSEDCCRADLVPIESGVGPRLDLALSFISIEKEKRKLANPIPSSDGSRCDTILLQGAGVGLIRDVIELGV
jgi:hypothetical protein